MNLRKQLFFVAFSFLTIGLLFAQKSEVIPDGVVKAIKTSDVNELALSFNDNIEIVLPGKTGVYSRSQAEMIIKDFFNRQPVKDFAIIHEGKKENASFAIGNYSSDSGNFRFTFLTKSDGTKVLIHQLRIEKQDE
ncbi:DUF4783 domain-containing protein [Carboxylicivirga sp. N1Y90]|uniref:DUF4783 domain-containing protein n=1 Tax=Carboxylicivirga fragile TaxID=3417571 RepID=UPI003D329004|nr:DUF4783 domain-containing protein [Marinilabiliaceae bacterium N1Y90]